MKLKRLGTILLAGLLAVGLTACGGSSSKKADTFTVGFDQNFPPFGYKDDKGNFTGFDIDLAKETAKRMNKKIKLQPIDCGVFDENNVLKLTGNDCVLVLERYYEWQGKQIYLDKTIYE